MKHNLYALLFEQAPEADPNDIFGQWFAPNKRGLKIDEPNTEKEEEVVNDLESFFSSNDPEPLNNSGGHKLLLQLAKAGKYSSVLEPDISWAFRGMSFEKPESLLGYAKKVGIKELEINTVDETDKLVKQVLPIAEAEKVIMKAEREQTPLFFSGEVFNSTFQPRQAGGVSSWTSDRKVAKQFASDYPYVAFHAAAVKGNNFFGKPGEIGRIGRFPHEKEIVGVGSIKTDRIAIKGETLATFNNPTLSALPNEWVALNILSNPFG